MDERVWREGTRTRRCFSLSAQVTHRCCSRSLQRVITDFGADVAFRQAAKKLQEHYGFTLSVERIRQVVEGHAQTMYEAQVLSTDWPQAPGVPWVVAQTDGGMIPIVTPDATQADKRRGKSLAWKEAKLCLAHAQGSATPWYGGTLQGGVDEAGKALFDCALHAGFGTQTRVHGVGDGATWIADQIDAQFAQQGQFLIDFYHACD